MYTSIFKYIDKVVMIVKPKQLLYLALDGVAPRAKMNQQRQRRFRSALDRMNKQSQHTPNNDNLQSHSAFTFDSNCITPGTEFMSRLSSNIIYYIRRKLNEDLLWRNMRVIFSGSEVPGEGEHKIMLYIRHMKMQSDYDVSLRHCIYGLDADLIMLSLVTHEPNFALLREEVIFGGQNNKKDGRKQLKKLNEFQCLHVSLLRQYLDIEYSAALNHTLVEFPYDIERIIDDIVFLAILVGNDFLPHLPTIDIGEGGLDTLYELYKKLLPTLGGYIVDAGSMNVQRLECVLVELGKLEAEIFHQRTLEKDTPRHRNQKQKAHEIDPDDWFSDEEVDGIDLSSDSDADAMTYEQALIQQQINDTSLIEQHKKQYYTERFPEFYGMISAHIAAQQTDNKNNYSLSPHTLHHPPAAMSPSPSPSPQPFTGLTVLQHSDGTSYTPAEHRRALVVNYLEGLHWVLKYYYSGCISWKWFYQYRYAPLASDMVDLQSIKIDLELGEPFKPLEQLLGVLPPQSGALLPTEYRNLMTDTSSAISQFYPQTFQVDMNGKKNAWEGIALIPFIDELKLLEAINAVATHKLTKEQLQRNIRFGNEYLFEYDENNRDLVKPQYLPSMPNIVDAHSRVSHFVLPPIPLNNNDKSSVLSATSHDTTQLCDTDIEQQQKAIVYNPALNGKFIPRPLPGCITPAPGYPNFMSLNVNGKLDRCSVNVFGSESKKHTLVIELLDTNTSIDSATQYIGSTVYVDYPYQQPALVTAVVDGKYKYTGNNNKHEISDGDVRQYDKDRKQLQNQWLITKAIATGDISVLVYVRLFVTMIRLGDGSTEPQYSKKETCVPAQLVLNHVSNPDPRYTTRPAEKLSDQYPLNTSMLYIGPKHYASTCIIQSIDNNKQTVNLSLTVSPPESRFGHKICHDSRLQYYPAYMVAKHLNIHPVVLGKLTSSVYVLPGKIDLGLKLKNSGKSLCVNDYARRVDNSWNNSSKSYVKHNNNNNSDQSVDTAAGQWEYSEKTIALVAAYQRRYPEFFDAMNKNPMSSEKYNFSEFVPVDAGSEYNTTEKAAVQYVENIVKWLNSLGINNLVLIPCSSQMMSDRGVRSIELESTRINKHIQSMKLPTVQLSDVPIYHLYKPTPSVPWSPTSKVTHELGDRVISVRSDDGVPYGLRGTIVGMHTQSNGIYVEIVFDTELISGTTLNGKCSNLRGQTLSLNSIVNLSKPVILNPKSINDEIRQHKLSLQQLDHTNHVTRSDMNNNSVKPSGSFGQSEHNIPRHSNDNINVSAQVKQSNQINQPQQKSVKRPQQHSQSKPALKSQPSEAQTVTIQSKPKQQLTPVSRADKSAANWSHNNQQAKLPSSTRPLPSAPTPPVNSADLAPAQTPSAVSALLKSVLLIGDKQTSSQQSQSGAPALAKSLTDGNDNLPDDPIQRKLMRAKQKKAQLQNRQQYNVINH